MEKISWRDRVGNEVSNTVKEERNILRTVKRRKDKWIVDVLCSNRLLKHIVEGKTEWKRRRYKQLLDNLKEKTGHGNLKTKTSYSVDNSIWKRLRTCRERDYEIN
jgi:hypothetical protein